MRITVLHLLIIYLFKIWGWKWSLCSLFIAELIRYLCSLSCFEITLQFPLANWKSKSNNAMFFYYYYLFCFTKVSLVLFAFTILRLCKWGKSMIIVIMLCGALYSSELVFIFYSHFRAVHLLCFEPYASMMSNLLFDISLLFYRSVCCC